MSRHIFGGLLALFVGAAVAAKPAAAGSLHVARVESQGPNLACAVSIALDDTGVADWSYLNPRNPPYVFGQFFESDALTKTASLEDVRLLAFEQPLVWRSAKAKPDCTGRVDLVLMNRSTSQDVVVKLEVPRVTEPCPTDWTPAAQTCKLSKRIAATGSASVALDLSFITLSTVLTPPEFDQLWWQNLLDVLLGANPTAEQLRRVTSTAPDGSPTPPAPTLTIEEFNGLAQGLAENTVVPLPAELSDALPPADRAEPTIGKVLQMSQDVWGKLAAAVREDAELAVLRALRGRLGPARVAAAARRELRLFASGNRAKALEMLANLDRSASIALDKIKKPAATFSVEFFGSADQPTNPTGYFRVWPNLEEPASTSTLKTKIETTLSRDVDLPKDDKYLTDSTPYDGSSLRHTSGLGTLTLAQTLGNRAKASVTLKFRGNDFGSTGDLNVTTSQYQIEIFNSAYVRASMGRFQFANPTDGIAISETGDGVRLRFREMSLSRRWKRESARGQADRANQDSTAWILTIDNMTTPGLSAVKSVSLIGLVGRESTPAIDDKQTACDPTKACPHSYATVGGSLNFSVPHERLGGSLGVYHSRRFDVEGVRKGKGTVGLLTLTRTQGEQPKDKPFKVTSLLALALGYGTGDDAKTDTDESYIGETASFGSDSSFLGSIAARTKVAGALVPVGLSNKTYVRASWESRTLSPLVPLAYLFGASKEDIDSHSWKVVWNFYRFNELVGGSHDLGHEIVFSTDVATPPGVTVSLSYARFFAAGALKPVLSEHEPWRLAAKLSASLP